MTSPPDSQSPAPGPGAPLRAVATVVDHPGRPSPLALVEPLAAPAEGCPWTRLPRESPGSWAQFMAFRDSAYPDGPAGRFQPRNLRALADVLGLAASYVRTLSASFKWYDRAGAYDRALDMARMEADLSEVQRVRTRHLRLLAKARSFAELELDKMIRRASDPEVSTATAREVKDILEFVIRNERLLMGEHTEHLKLEGEWNLEGLELEELEALAKLQAKALAPGDD